MAAPLSGPGLGLQLPQHLYPSELNNAPYDAGSNYCDLAAGDAIAIPRGSWLVNPGRYSLIQYLDPVSQSWRIYSVPRGQPSYIDSDGFNLRVANLTGCPIGAVVTNAGSGYTQATTTCVSSTGGSTWKAIVGGMVSVTSMSAAGAGYGVAPLVFIDAPPAPGVQATAYATITSGTVSGVTMTNWGAGYTSTPNVVIVTSPYDPNLGSAITQAVVVLGTFGSGSIAAVICTDHGAPASPTLTIAGTGGSNGAATAVVLQTVTSGSVVAAGDGFTAGAGLITVGGRSTATPVNTNPAIELTNFTPRPLDATMAKAGASLVSVSTIYDGGLFTGAPTALVIPAAGYLQTTAASVTVALGSAVDTVMLQPILPG